MSVLNNDVQQYVKVIDVWKHIDFMYMNYILNGLDNILYNMYSSVPTAKELWEALIK